MNLCFTVMYDLLFWLCVPLYDGLAALFDKVRVITAAVMLNLLKHQGDNRPLKC